MTNEDLRTFLRNNLEISLSQTDTEYDGHGGKTSKVEVELLLATSDDIHSAEYETISRGWVWL